MSGRDQHTQWLADARWLPNGLPANMAAILHDQYLRTAHRRKS